MSDRLREALAVMREELPKQRAPVTYLHDESGQPFAALVTLEFLDTVPEEVWDGEEHSHIEGDEDE